MGKHARVRQQLVQQRHVVEGGDDHEVGHMDGEGGGGACEDVNSQRGVPHEKVGQKETIAKGEGEMDCHSARLQQSKGSGGGEEDIAECGDAGDGAGDAFAHGRRLQNTNRNRGNLMNE